ncbi:internal head protein [Pseudomonas phage vB_Pae10145-KEN51]|uniref:PHIKZ163 n=5 Tax=Viruses TaxID=10239 RepID=Q8SCZ9_BPDPK|nr:hypothetical protein [Pseudomonas aeruginosa]NP_803729.1 internal head protein [Pseudomonas phage phiKZ]YP_009617496.1 internal head protein [Pseudomonas phage PA7]YP_009619719.1 internal head protein [Pseudomonas phage SL2]ANM44958.1 putative structural head protein [Pseudomonas phage KTN4]QGK89830.1 hypothetical protein [Pseudomonas phage vB_PA32_GUMS]QOV08048.1 structural protein [Pseudomonas phage vB_PaeM_kmuB]QYV99356.1 hypothetical protein [Pseudomonas phage U1B]QYV99812.1 hypothet
MSTYAELLITNNELKEAIVSVEAYRHRLARYQDLLDGRDVASEDLSKAMSFALESIDPAFSIKEGGIITLRALKDALVRAAKAARDIVRMVIETLTAFYVKFTGSISHVRKTQQKLSRRLAKLGNRTTNTRLTVSGLQRLSINGEFIGDRPDNLLDIKEVTNYILMTYPKMTSNIARNISRQALNILDNQGEDTTTEIIDELLQSFADIVRRDFKAPPGDEPLKKGETTSTGTHRSYILPANRAFVYTDADHIATSVTNKQSALEMVRNTFTMEFTELQINAIDSTERDIEVPSVTTLSDIVTGIANILTIAERAKQGEVEYKTVKVVVDDSIRQLAERSELLGRANGEAINMLAEISRKLAEPVGNYTHWLAVTLKVWLTFVSHCITHYENEGI